MKCILHIGTEKTGTSVIQEWLYANRQQLSQQGVYLSTVMETPNNRDFVAYFQDEYDDWFHQKLIDSEEKKAAYFESYSARLSAELKAASNKHHTVIITSEHFHSRLRKPERMALLKEFLSAHCSEITVVCYFREQAEMCRSLYSTSLKVSGNQTLQRFESEANEANYYFNFFEIATRWSEVFGRERCVFRLYDRKRFLNGDLRQDFIKLALPDCDVDRLDMRITDSNSSVSLLEAHVLKAINTAVPYWNPGLKGVNPANLWLKNTIRRCEKLNVGKINQLSTENLSVRFKQSNEAFFKNFFPGETGFPPARTTEAEEEMISVKAVGGIIEELLTQLLGDIAPRLLTVQDGEQLRDIAFKQANNQPLLAQDAITLLKLAQRAKPAGEIIRKRLQELLDQTTSRGQ